jgi:crotonobetainyl-CoA:carnitine CoA-transferase CaiB-like acyl-CoA transferase
MQTELRAIFKTKSSAEWLELAEAANTAIAPVNTSRTIMDDPQFQHRFPLYGVDQLGAEQLPLPLHLVGEDLPVPTKAPEVGQDTDAVLRDVLGYDDTRIAELRESGTFGSD